MVLAFVSLSGGGHLSSRRYGYTLVISVLEHALYSLRLSLLLKRDTVTKYFPLLRQRRRDNRSEDGAVVQ